MSSLPCGRQNTANPGDSGEMDSEVGTLRKEATCGIWFAGENGSRAICFQKRSLWIWVPGMRHRWAGSDSQHLHQFCGKTWLETPFLVSLASQEHYEPLNIFFLNSLFFYFISQNCLLWVATKTSANVKMGTRGCGSP